MIKNVFEAPQMIGIPIPIIRCWKKDMCKDQDQEYLQAYYRGYLEQMA